MKLSRVSAAAAGALALALVVPTSAPASPVVSDPIVSGLVGPLQIDLGHHGKIYVAQAFSGVLTQVNRDGSTTLDTSKEVGRTPMKMSKPPALVETYKMTLDSKDGKKGTLTLAWENVVASVDIAAK